MSDQQIEQRSASAQGKSLGTEPPGRASTSHNKAVASKASTGAAGQEPSDPSSTGDARKHDEAARENNGQPTQQNIPPPPQPSPSLRQQPRRIIRGTRTRRVSSNHSRSPQLEQQALLSDDDNDSDGGVLLPKESDDDRGSADIGDVPLVLLHGHRGGYAVERRVHGEGSHVVSSVKGSFGGGGEKAASRLPIRQMLARGDEQRREHS